MRLSGKELSAGRGECLDLIREEDLTGKNDKGFYRFRGYSPNLGGNTLKETQGTASQRKFPPAMENWGFSMKKKTCKPGKTSWERDKQARGEYFIQKKDGSLRSI